MDEPIIVKIDDTPPVQPAVQAINVPTPAQPPSAPHPAQSVPFDEARFLDTLGSVMDKYPEQATRVLKEKLGVTKLELSSALADACLEHGIDKATADKYRNLLSGDTPEATRARVAEFASLRGSLQSVATAQPVSPEPVAQSTAPQYQAPAPLQPTPNSPVDITKLPYDEQLKMLQETAAREWKFS